MKGHDIEKVFQKFMESQRSLKYDLLFKERKDNSPLFKYTVGWIPGGKQITETLGVFNTTKRNDTFWDKMFGDDNAIYK